jgi:choline dehydrogenase-like flavoprotein
VLFKKQGGEQVATGITGTWTPRDEYLGITDKIKRATRRVTINASKVIVSAGTLQSPLLLLRSGIRNYHVGRNLYLHPVSMLGALHDEKDNPWDGPILTSVCTEFENLDGKNHGVKLETPSMTPFTYMVWMPWHNGEQYKQLVSKMGNMTGYISVCKDRDTGRVYPDAETGRCHVEYHPSRFDKKHVMEGLLALARINYVSGARELWTSSSPFEHFIREDEDDQATNDAKFEEWLEKVRAHGFPYPESLFVAAHQMGTCRMSASPKAGVVDQTGRVWGTRGLHVIDASVFPTASGVNPMSTVMAIADSLSRTLVKQWTAGKL